jgi:serine/threonine protein kinase
MPPDVIAERYEVIRPVGRGGMGTVWLCRDKLLNRDVALKQIGTVPGEGAASTVRAMREARLSAALSHENAVSLYDIVHHDGSPWLVMEYVPSRTLGEILKQDGPLPVRRVVRIGAQLAAALASAHTLGIVHRDIKPGNVLVGADDLAKISDFGIARGHQDARLTQTGLVTGTPAYFSPELARGGDPSQASDVWGLGATLYAAIEGAPPYGTQPNPLALLARIATEPPPPPPAGAGELKSTLAAMLDPDPITRMSMSAAHGALEGLAHPSDATAARARERDRAYTDTTIHDQPAGFLAATLKPGQRDADRPPDSPALPPPADPGEERATRRPSVALVAVGLLAALILVAGGVALLLALTSDGSGDRATPPLTPRHHRSPHGSAGATGGTGSGAGGSSASNTPSTTATTTAAPPPSQPRRGGRAMVSFVTTYFHTVPADTKTGWQELAPSMRQVGKGAYESFWGSIDSVDVAHAHAVPGAKAVEYQITYHFSDGRVVLERQRLDLAPHGNSYWITKDIVLSSTTLSQ